MLFKPNIDKLKKTIFSLKKALEKGEMLKVFTKSLLFFIDNTVPPIPARVIYSIADRNYFGMNHPEHKVKIVAFGKNLGYGSAHNLAIRAHNFKYHLILNPDVYIDEDSLITCWNYAESHEEVVLIGPSIYSPEGSFQYLLRRNPTVLDAFLRFLGIFFKGLRHIRRYRLYECQDLDQRLVHENVIMSGCCMWCRTASLVEIGGFDERFFLYYEDYDLSKRLSKVGKTIFLPSFRVIHDWERRIEKSPKLMLLNIQSAIKFFNKWGWRIV